MVRRTLLLGLLAATAAACRPDPQTRGDNPPPATPTASPALEGTFAEAFDAGKLDARLWNATSGAYAVRDGALLAQNARNKPLWLLRRLPCDVRIDVTAWSDSPDGDLKVEAMGDGASYDPDQGEYRATGYVFIFGGWHNSLSTIVRQDEHRARMTVDETTRVEPGRKYRWSIRIASGHIEWWVDDALFLQADDPQPLCGPGHDHFGVNNWAVPNHYDDLTISPLTIAP